MPRPKGSKTPLNILVTWTYKNSSSFSRTCESKTELKALIVQLTSKREPEAKVKEIKINLGD